MVHNFLDTTLIWMMHIVVGRVWPSDIGNWRDVAQTDHFEAPPTGWLASHGKLITQNSLIGILMRRIRIFLVISKRDGEQCPYSRVDARIRCGKPSRMRAVKHQRDNCTELVGWRLTHTESPFARFGPIGYIRETGLTKPRITQSNL